MPIKTIKEMWEEYQKKNSDLPDCCEFHRERVRQHFYAGVIALHEYITGETFLEVDTLDLTVELEKEIAAFEKECKEFAFGHMPLGSEKVQ